jgi:hypothetical protein
MLTTQVPGSLFTSSNSTPSLLIYMIPYLTSPFIDLRLLIHAPDLFCDVTFPLTLLFISGCLRTLRDSYVTFDFLLPIPFYLFPDFNLLPNNTFVFDFSEIHALTSSFIQDTLSATAELLRIRMYNSNVTLAYDSHPYRHTPKFRRPSRRTRNLLDNQDPFCPHSRQPFRRKTSHPRKRD